MMTTTAKGRVIEWSDIKVMNSYLNQSLFNRQLLLGLSQVGKAGLKLMQVIGEN